jgi:hypothetical protein
VSILARQAIQSVKEDQRVVKKQKTLAGPKNLTPKKRRLVRMTVAEMKVQDVPEKTTGPSPSSSVDVSEILKVMTEPFPFAMLSPLGSDRLAYCSRRRRVLNEAWKERRLLRLVGGMSGAQKSSE